MRHIDYEEDYGVTPERAKELRERDEKRYNEIMEAIKDAKDRLKAKMRMEELK